MNTRHLTFLGVLVLPTCNATSACVAPDPVATAQWIYANHRTFAFQKAGDDLKQRTTFLSHSLYGLLRAEWKCQDKEQGLCNLDADPWINAQDGDELAPLTFDLVAPSAATATVLMRFRFSLNPPFSEPAEAKLLFIKDAKSGCWLLDDLIGMQKQSLRQQLRPVSP